MRFTVGRLSGTFPEVSLTACSKRLLVIHVGTGQGGRVRYDPPRYRGTGGLLVTGWP